MRVIIKRRVMRIAVFLPAAFAAVLAAVAFLVGAAWLQGRDQHRVLSEIAGRDSSTRSAAFTIAETAEAINTRLLGVLADVYSSAGMAPHVEKLYAELEANWSRIDSLIASEQDRSRIAPLAAAFGNLSQVKPKIVEALKSAKKARVSQAYDEWIEISVPFRRALKSATDALDKNSAEKIAGVLSSSDRGLMVALILGMIVGFVGVLAGCYVLLGVTKPLGSLAAEMQKLAAGKFDLVLPGLRRADEIGDIARSVEGFKLKAEEKASLDAEKARLDAEKTSRDAETKMEQTRRAAQEQEERARREAEAAKEVAGVVDAFALALDRIAQGDLTAHIPAPFPSRFAKLQNDFNATTAQLRETILAIASSTREFVSAAAEISTSTADLSRRTDMQAANLEETSASVEQFTATVNGNAESARHASVLTTNAREFADQGGQVMAETANAMARIAESSNKIGDIIAIIDEIARQTNLLALNAAVEAARAGEAGRGFAVVASEVRGLAQRSSQAAKDIKSLITRSSAQVQEGVQLTQRADDSLTKIVESIKKVSDIVSEIANASAEQSRGLHQIKLALTQIDEITQQNSALVEENAATAKSLEHQSVAIMEKVGFFRTDDVASIGKPARVADFARARQAGL